MANENKPRQFGMTESTEKSLRRSEVWLRQIGAPVARHASSRTPSVSHLGVAAFSLEDQVACRESMFLLS